MLLWNQIDVFESTCSIEYRGLSLRVVAVMTSMQPKASARVFACLADGAETECGTLDGYESLDEALEAGQHLAIAHADATSVRR